MRKLILKLNLLLQYKFNSLFSRNSIKDAYEIFINYSYAITDLHKIEYPELFTDLTLNI